MLFLNIAKIMIPKSSTVFLHERQTVRQWWEVMTRGGIYCHSRIGWWEKIHRFCYGGRFSSICVQCIIAGQTRYGKAPSRRTCETWILSFGQHWCKWRWGHFSNAQSELCTNRWQQEHNVRHHYQTGCYRLLSEKKNPLNYYLDNYKIMPYNPS